MFEVITARQLAAMLDDGAAFTLVDTRPRESYEAWHVPGAVSFPFGPTEELTESRLPEVTELVGDYDEPVVTICGKGVTSANLAVNLDRQGYDEVFAVGGGMREWNELYETATHEPDDDLVVVQLQRRAKGCLSYLVGSRRAGDAVVVDAGRHTDQYIVRAAELGLGITRTLDTHVHADHVSGGRELADRLGIHYHLGAGASDRDVDVDYVPLSDGESVSVGEVPLTALSTPGHTSEMTSYRLGDLALFSGDALFVDSLGRTELQFGDEGAAEGARMAYETLHEVFAGLSEDLLVLPGHVDVSAAGHYSVGAPGVLVGERLEAVIDGLEQFGLDEAAFVDRMTTNLSEKPANYERVIRINRGVEALTDPIEAIDVETGRNNCAV
ncbi:rhodanese-like domain-containing protein [Halomicroarcula sp. GCM10025324]|uniref:MBL fold metallo-hydrolase n=1 Tax=Haloarcula TaxID=2237 RepID=UPI0023E7DEFA|nr:rhodanese-like domain-containing protein [Halomicroarcula sp. ZS-22-S1]